MDDLIVAALQEGRVDGAERLHAFGSEAGGESHRVLLGDADIEHPIGKGFGEDVESGAARHGRGDSDDAFVLARLLDQALAEHLGVGRRLRLRLHLRAGGDVERRDAVAAIGRGSAGE